MPPSLRKDTKMILKKEAINNVKLTLSNATTNPPVDKFEITKVRKLSALVIINLEQKKEAAGEDMIRLFKKYEDTQLLAKKAYNVISSYMDMDIDIILDSLS